MGTAVSRISHGWRSRRALALLLEILVPVALVAAWWAWASRGSHPYFPPVPTILRTLAHDWFPTDLRSELLPSLVRLGFGYTISVGVGIGVGVVLGSSRVARACASPFVEFLRSIPPPVLIPLAIVLFGLGNITSVTIIIFATVWPVLLNTMDGVAGVDPTLTDTARVYHLPRRTVLVKLVLPAASPRIFAGARSSLAIGIIVMVVSEMLIGTSGIGFYILKAQQTFELPQMWAGMLLLGILGYLLNLGFEVVESRVLRWHRNARRLDQL